LILASSSPQRQAILTQLGIGFEVVVPEIAEGVAGEPAEVVRENAERKAQTVAGQRPDANLVLGVDTAVAVGDELYGKPADESAARRMLRRLSGCEHRVLSGLCLIGGTARQSVVAITTVRFRSLSEPMLDWYLATGEWRGRAGGYAIQRRGAALVESVDGDYLNVVGLPVSALLTLAPQLLWDVTGAGN
jgi:septum formation protein